MQVLALWFVFCMYMIFIQRLDRFEWVLELMYIQQSIDLVAENSNFEPCTPFITDFLARLWSKQQSIAFKAYYFSRISWLYWVVWLIAMHAAVPVFQLLCSMVKIIDELVVVAYQLLDFSMVKRSLGYKWCTETDLLNRMDWTFFLVSLSLF